MGLGSRIVALEAHLVRLPLRREIRHASAARQASENLIVACHLADGTVGYGEGIPRPYVTGETPDGALAQLAATDLDAQLRAPAHDWPGVIRLCQAFQPLAIREDPRGSGSNALRAAVELAILDAFGRAFGEPASAVAEHFAPAASVLVPAAQRPARVRYSSAITAEGPLRERMSALKMRLYGFAQVKVKVGVSGQDDARRLAAIRSWAGPAMDLRVDANEAWTPEELLARWEEIAPARISCLEQPVPHARVRELAPLREKLGVSVMLDESLTSMVDARDAIVDGTCDLFNLRLSKCGGFLECLDLAAFAYRYGLGCQLGCHPGESGLLSAAGRHFACLVGGLRYLEGSYDRHLLRDNLVHEDVTFGPGGWAPALQGPGWGVTVDPVRLARLSQRSERLEVGF